MDKRVWKIMQIVLFTFFISTTSYALPFIVTPKPGVDQPTTLISGTTTKAFYTVLNNTLAQRNNNFVKYLPPNVTQVTSNFTFNDACGANFNLAGYGQAGDSCTLELLISGSVNVNDPDPHHHLFVCFPKGETCAGTESGLNVTLQTLPARFAYIANSSNSTVSYCGVDSNGALIACNVTGFSFSGPSGLALHPTASILYVANQSANNITYCSINDNGTLSNCIVTGAGLSSPTDIAINPTGTFAYITNMAANNVVVCPINGDFSLGTCTPTGSGFAGPNSVTIDVNDLNVYVANATSNNLSQCVVNLNGTLSACTITGSSVLGLNGIVLDPSNTYAWVASQVNNTIESCFINGDSSLAACTTAASGFATPFFTAFDSLNSLAYITNNSNNTVSVCSVDLDTGTLSECVTTGSGFNSPKGIVIQTLGVN